MLRCTYIVLIRNDEQHITNLVHSLRQVGGDFWREYIFVDDGSTDASLSILKTAIGDLPRTTIITQSNQGPSISINKAVNLATGDYIHFVEGGELLYAGSTVMLLESCIKLGTGVAVGKVLSGEIVDIQKKKNVLLIESPIEGILSYRYPDICRIGQSGSLVNCDLLEKVGKADTGIYAQNMSISLRCAKSSKFAYLDSYVSYKSSNRTPEDIKFTIYNNLKAVYNFASQNQELFATLVPQLLKFLSHQMVSKGDQVGYLMKSFSSKYLKISSLHRVLAAYEREIDKLF